MDWIDYREKLGVGFSDEEKISLFYTRTSNFLSGLVYSRSVEITSDEYITFCNETGLSLTPSLLWDGEGRNDRLRDCIHILMDHQRSFADYLSYFVWFVNSVGHEDGRLCNKDDYKTLLTRCLEQSHIQYDLLEDNGKIFIFPKGARELDDALVSEPLEWLSSYPKAHAAFVKALKDYSGATKDTASEVADKFRKSLETFFQEFFGGNKSLENYKSDYGAYLKSHGVPKEISGNLETLLQTYTNYMNSYAKHRDATSDTVLEYLMYQTGNIIRLLITLK